MLLTHWPPQPQQDPHSTLKRKTSSSVMDGLQKEREGYDDSVGAHLTSFGIEFQIEEEAKVNERTPSAAWDVTSRK